MALSMLANATSCPKNFTYIEARGWLEAWALHSESCVREEKTKINIVVATIAQRFPKDESC